MLDLPRNINYDLRGKDTALVPFVVIGNWDDNFDAVADYLMISTGSLSFPEFSAGTWTAKPLLLNIPSIKESLDVESRNYKISNVTLELSNYPYEGKRLSDTFGSYANITESLINVECRIFWASPQVSKVNFFDIQEPDWDPQDEAALQVYYGVIRRYTHDDEKVRLVLEDRSQVSLHKDLPGTNVGSDVNVPDKGKNKYIPMVYGDIDRSPLVPHYSVNETVTTEEGEVEELLEYRLKADTHNTVNFEDTESIIEVGQQILRTSALYFFENNVYFNVQRTATELNVNSSGSEEGAPNFIYGETDIVLDTTSELEGTEGQDSEYELLNDTAKGVLRLNAIRRFSRMDTVYADLGSEAMHLDVMNNFDPVDKKCIGRIYGVANCAIWGGFGAAYADWTAAHFKCFLEPLNTPNNMAIDEDDGTIIPPVTWLVLNVVHYNFYDETSWSEDGYVPTGVQNQFSPGTDFGAGGDIASDASPRTHWAVWHGATPKLQWGQGGSYESNGLPYGLWGDVLFYPYSHNTISAPLGADAFYGQSIDKLDWFKAIDSYDHVCIGIPYFRWNTSSVTNQATDDMDWGVDFSLNDAFLVQTYKVMGITDKDYFASIRGRSDAIAAQTETYYVISAFDNSFWWHTEPETFVVHPSSPDFPQNPISVHCGVSVAGSLDINGGLCSDGQYWYLTDSQGVNSEDPYAINQGKIEKWDTNLLNKIAIRGDISPWFGYLPINTETLESSAWYTYDPPPDHPIFRHTNFSYPGYPPKKWANRLWDCDYYNGYVLVGACRWEGLDPTHSWNYTDGHIDPQLIVFNSSDLSVANVANLHADVTGIPDSASCEDPGHAATAVAADAVNNILFIATLAYNQWHADGAPPNHRTDRIAAYNLNTILDVKCEFIGWYQIINTIGTDAPNPWGQGGQHLVGIVGMTLLGGYLYCSDFNANIWVLQPDYVYQRLYLIGYHENSHQSGNYVGCWGGGDGSTTLYHIWNFGDDNNPMGSASSIRMRIADGEAVDAPPQYVNNYAGEGGGLITSPPDIAYHIMDTELNAGVLEEGSPDPGDPDFSTGLWTSRWAHSGWDFAFTISKKINSKKLLEGILSNSKSFLRYNTSGKYGFITINNFTSYEEHDLKIRDDSIISLKYGRTKIENVYTSIAIEYHKDYGQDRYIKYLDYVNADQFGLLPPNYNDGSPLYFTDYYGLASDHSESKKLFTSEYIRDKSTAMMLQEFLLNWHCNQHLLLFIDLPLSIGMRLEVGDVVVFDKTTEVLPYGIDYANQDDFSSSGMQRVNGQQVYPQFLVYEINKQIDKISIKCMQLHRTNYAISGGN